MNENIQNTTQSNVENFKKVYSETLAECIERRKVSGMTQKGLAEWFNVDVRKIIELEKGNGGVGLFLRYADIFDIEVKLISIKH